MVDVLLALIDLCANKNTNYMFGLIKMYVHSYFMKLENNYS